MNNVDLFIEKFLIFDLKIREKEGVDYYIYNELLQLLHLISIDYRNEEVIPKKLADIFLDMWGALTSSAYLYDEYIQEEINQIADNLCHKARKIFIK